MMQNSITEIVAAICALLAAVGGLIQLIYTVKTKNAIEDRDNATKNQLALLAAEAAAAKERAEAATNAIIESKQERKVQLDQLERKIDESKAASETALEAANGHKATIAQAAQQMVELREDLNKIAKTQS